MQSIERYGVIALIFLVVTVVAVLMWDSKKSNAGETSSALGARESSLVESNPARTSLRGTGRPLLRGGELGALRGADDATIPTHVDGESSLAERTNALAEDEGRAPLSAGSPTAAAPLADRALREVATGAERSQPILPTTAKRLYTVRKGDTLSEIAARELGSSKRWQDIIDVNPGLDPAKLSLGTRLVMPGAPAETRAGAGAPTALVKAPASKTDATKAPVRYVVHDGDSLWKIAAQELGDGERWQEIVALNPKQNPNLLKAGQTLVLPAGGRAKAQSAQSDGGEAVLVAASSSSDPASRTEAESASRKGKVR